VGECKPLQVGRYMAEFREYSNKYGFRHRSETAEIAIEAGAQTGGLHSYTLELNLSTFGTHSWVKLGYVGHRDSSS